MIEREIARGNTRVPQELQWIPLPQDELEKQLAYYGHIPSDIDRWYIDKPLADAFDVVNHVAKENGCKMFESRQLSESLRDRNFTKFFRHWDKTKANIDHFLDDSCSRPDRRWLTAYKGGRLLLSEILQGMGKLVPIFIENEEDLLSIYGDKNTSAGFGGLGSKADNAENIFAIFSELKRLIAKTKNDPAATWPRSIAVCFHRAQISNYVSADGSSYNPDYKQKDRLVLGIDGATVAIEGQYAKPLYEALLHLWWNYSGGDTPETLRRKMRKMRLTNDFWFQTDYSCFDQTIQDWLIRDLFEMIKDVFPKEYHYELNWIAENFINTRILVPGEGIIEKHRGISSGSYFTQVIGSLANALMLLTYLCSTVTGTAKERAHKVKNMLHGTKSAPMTFQVLGDDSFVCLTQRVDLNAMSKYVDRVFGVKMSPEKTKTSDQYHIPQYLKREWRDNGEWRNPLELVIALTHPERGRTYEGYSPWHIMYGLFLTYRAAFPWCITDEWLIYMMESHGGIEALVELEVSDLPGPLRGYGHKRLGEYLRAKALLRGRAA